MVCFVINIVTESKPAFENSRQHVIECFANENNVTDNFLINKFQNIIFLKKVHNLNLN